MEKSMSDNINWDMIEHIEKLVKKSNKLGNKKWSCFEIPSGDYSILYSRKFLRKGCVKVTISKNDVYIREYHDKNGNIFNGRRALLDIKDYKPNHKIDDNYDFEFHFNNCLDDFKKKKKEWWLK